MTVSATAEEVANGVEDTTSQGPDPQGTGTKAGKGLAVRDVVKIMTRIGHYTARAGQNTTIRVAIAAIMVERSRVVVDPTIEVEGLKGRTHTRYLNHGRDLLNTRRIANTTDPVRPDTHHTTTDFLTRAGDAQ
jgi:hypothetical protein